MKTIKRLKVSSVQPDARTVRKVRRVRRMLKEGKTKVQISRVTKLSVRQIARIASREAWANISDE